ncbi:Iron-sulfur binding domain-containing protein [Desulfonema limicola]|uniref:Iron-sulfur binding domain-containing protein n=1 Tax=Desulfonema limicola TaxID=45656 RepID=A0A975BBT9_9BACT|nr:4Fe-4S binding protein [Desulfonema limicola]QTA82461.1 Iron-sulfur binding domain-containing protein [Desulfonema limicola]
MKIIRKIIEIDEELCDGCGQCVPGCAEGALKIVDGKARVVEDRYCDGLGACIGECPTGALKIVEREAEDFDEAAVEEHLAKMENKEPENKKDCACPSAGIQVFTPLPHAERSGTDEDIKSALSHWPIKIRLIPPDAPFLKNADILVLADCSAAAFPALHQDLLKGKIVMMGCPKFDDVQIYIDRFADIFKTAGIKSITSVYMEVPCCSALPGILKKAMKISGADIPVEELVVTRKGGLSLPKPGQTIKKMIRT